MTVKIIAGKRYDTATATEVASISNDYPSNDFRHCEESLYRTKRGKWFTCGSGGALSVYARKVESNAWQGSSDVIRAISDDEARTWLENNNETDAIEQYFGTTIEDA